MAFQLPNVENLKNYYLDPERSRIFNFNPNISFLDESYQKSIPKLLKALKIMDVLFLIQDHPQSLELREYLVKEINFGNKDAEIALKVFNIFNGPEGITYDNNKEMLFPGIIERPKGGTLYDETISVEEFDEYIKENPDVSEDFNKFNTIIKKENGKLISIPYEIKYRNHLHEASKLLSEVAEIVSDKNFSLYLKAKSKSLISGNYFDSDVTWIKSITSPIDLVIGPLEVYEDTLMSKKAFYGGALLVKNVEESLRVEKYIEHLQELENALPNSLKFGKDIKKINVPVAVVDILYMVGEYQANRPGIVVG
ncbi:hypothetical protein J4216_06785, partial [Candidatus Woesearchaeota archaeon]|nr:hypothetical protein [Candidatus Woesearchaeota archaeon]